MAEESKTVVPQTSSDAPTSLNDDEIEFRFFEGEEDLQTIIGMIA